MEQSLTFNDLPSAVTMLTKEVSELKRLIIEKQEQQNSEQPEQLLNVDGAAEFFVPTRPTIYSKCSRNEIPFMKRSKRLYFSSTELMEYIKEGRNKTASDIDQEVDEYLSNSKKK